MLIVSAIVLMLSRRPFGTIKFIFEMLSVSYRGPWTTRTLSVFNSITTYNRSFLCRTKTRECDKNSIYIHTFVDKRLLSVVDIRRFIRQLKLIRCSISLPPPGHNFDVQHVKSRRFKQRPRVNCRMGTPIKLILFDAVIFMDYNYTDIRAKPLVLQSRHLIATTL